MVKIIRFTADWCAPCKMLAPLMDRVQSQLPGVVFETVNIDKQSDRAAAAGVRNIPLVIIEKDGEVVDRIPGVNPESVYLSKIQAA